MTDILVHPGGVALTLHLGTALEFGDEQFAGLARQNPDLRLERTAEGDLLVMPPTDWNTGRRNAGISAHLWNWTIRDGNGVAFDSSTGFALPNGAIRSPDASWMRRSRLAHLSAEEKDCFLPFCPDFVLEIRSPHDSLAATQSKMEEYLANGARLGWLLDVVNHQVFVYRPDKSVEQLDSPATLSAEPELPGFMLDLTSVWESPR